MKTIRMSSVALLAALAYVLPAAQAANRYPSKPIRMVIPFPTGGSNDLLSRFLGIKLTQRLGEQVVIDNRGGANGIIGADIAAQAPADGYTLLMISTSFVMNAALRTLPYDVERSFDPVSMIGTSPNCIVVNPAAGFATLRDLVERARAKPASIFYASTGIGSFNHFGGELFKRHVGIDLVHVPYKGGGPAMIDVMSGQIPMMFSSVTQVLPHVRTGKLKVLAVGADKRAPALPDVPTVAEAGYPGYTFAVWWGMAGPAGMPAAVVDTLHKTFTAILADPATHERLAADAAETLYKTPPEMRTMIREEVKKWTGVAKSAGISAQ